VDALLKQRYRLIEEIGRGGMAVVYRGEDTELNRQVAVKILHSFLADKEEARKRFQREARVVARLRHENILEIFDFSGLDSKDAFIVTEFIEGQTLATFLEDHPITVPEVAACILSQVCKAVIHAHGQGVIHRDIKPENIMIRKDGVIKLMDFGIAQMVDTQKLTLTGQLLGSPAYMAPEMVTGGPLDFRTDVFSLGVLLYRLATGQLPFTGNNPHEVLKKIADGDFLPASMSCPAVSEDLDTIIDKALTVEPENRYQSVAALDKALSGIISDLGRKDGTKETKEFFAHPDAYQKTLRKELVARLLAEAKAMGRARRLSTALRILNRILFLDEHNPEVPKLLDWIRRKQALGDFLRKIAQVSAVFLLIGVAGAAVWLFEQHSGSERSGPAGPRCSHPDDARGPRCLPLAQKPGGRSGPGTVTYPTGCSHTTREVWARFQGAWPTPTQSSRKTAGNHQGKTYIYLVCLSHVRQSQGGRGTGPGLWPRHEEHPSRARPACHPPL